MSVETNRESIPNPSVAEDFSKNYSKNPLVVERSRNEQCFDGL